MRYYLAYGMNTNISEMAQRCPGAVNIGRCTLKNYELKFRYHADIDFALGNEMEGVLWEITPACEQALDNLEGFPAYYKKLDLVVEQNDQAYIAMAYIMTKKAGEQPPALYYENCLIEGYTANGLNTESLTTLISQSYGQKTN